MLSLEFFFFFYHTEPALRSIYLFSPLLKGDQFQANLTAQEQNAVPRIFVFLTYQAYQNSNALFKLRLLLVIMTIMMVMMIMMIIKVIILKNFIARLFM